MTGRAAGSSGSESGGEDRRRAWTLALRAGVFLLAALWLWRLAAPPAAERVPYSRFKEEVAAGRVAEVTFEGERLTGTRRPAADEPAAPEDRFVTVRPPLDDPDLLPLLAAHGVSIAAEPSALGWWAPLLWNALPLAALVLIFVYGSRLISRGGDRAMTFTKAGATRYLPDERRVTFEDVAGLETSKTELREVIDFLKDPARFQRLGAKVPRGILLMGPPGTGKTLLARAVAGEAAVPFFSISGSQFVELFVGVGASRVRDLFESARREAPSILFIDEIDSVGRVRTTGAVVGGAHDEREQTLNQILAAMDGFAPQEAVVVLAATNRPDILDPALLRPGRFDRKIVLELPHREARRRILEVHTRRVPLAEDVDLASLAVRTVGFSGADLANLVNEAALLAARRRAERVEAADFEAARDRILFGGEREGPVAESQKGVTAYHEAGHALVATLLPDADPLEKVTIIPRGRALGGTELLPPEEARTVRRAYLLSRLAVLLAGRCAERLAFGDVSTGAEEDLRTATALARRMICRWGMSERLGPVVFAGDDPLGREPGDPGPHSDATARLVDEEVTALLRRSEERAAGVLAEHRAALDALARALLEHETLRRDEVEATIAAAGAGLAAVTATS